MNTFDLLFEPVNDTMRYPTHYNFFYYRQSPRGNAKFGITHLPWERLRMQQQGTDEEIQFDYAWMMKATSKYKIETMEEELKYYFGNYCLYLETTRAGHTEWFKNVSAKEFMQKFFELAEKYKIEIIEIANPKKPYVATRSSECPLGSPSGHGGKAEAQRWSAVYWQTLIHGAAQ